jgi:hypothetical protein
MSRVQFPSFTPDKLSSRRRVVHAEAPPQLVRADAPGLACVGVHAELAATSGNLKLMAAEKEGTNRRLTAPNGKDACANRAGSVSHPRLI